METYDEILRRMEETYAQESGHEPEDVSDTGLRLKVLAGELYRLQSEIAWLKNQAFPQTAAGKQLDSHGALRGVFRKPPAHAQGTLTFSRYLPLSFDVVIPEGTVCAIPGEDPVEYETTVEVVLSSGSLTVDAPAQAVLGGAAGNAASGYVNTLSSPLLGINYVTNKQAFTGGRDEETDEEYRPRVLKAYENLPNASNAAYYREVALTVEGVTEAGAKPRADGVNTVTVYVWGEGAAPSSEVIEAVKKELERRREVGVTVTVKAASLRTMSVGVRIKPAAGEDVEAAKAAVASAVKAYFAGQTLGSSVYKAEIERAVLNAAPITGVEFTASVTDIPGNVAYVTGLSSVAVEVIA